jgi:hypothetical protein
MSASWAMAQAHYGIEHFSLMVIELIVESTPGIDPSPRLGAMSRVLIRHPVQFRLKALGRDSVHRRA